MTGGTAGPGASEQPGELQKSDLAALGRVGRLLFQLPAAGPLCDRGGGGGGGRCCGFSLSSTQLIHRSVSDVHVQGISLNAGEGPRTRPEGAHEEASDMERVVGSDVVGHSRKGCWSSSG